MYITCFVATPHDSSIDTSPRAWDDMTRHCLFHKVWYGTETRIPNETWGSSWTDLETTLCTPMHVRRNGYNYDEDKISALTIFSIDDVKVKKCATCGQTYKEITMVI